MENIKVELFELVKRKAGVAYISDLRRIPLKELEPILKNINLAQYPEEKKELLEYIACREI